MKGATEFIFQKLLNMHLLKEGIFFGEQLGTNLQALLHS